MLLAVLRMPLFELSIDALCWTWDSLLSRDLDLSGELFLYLVFFFDLSLELLRDFADMEDWDRSRIIFFIFGFLIEAFEVLFDETLCFVAC